MHSGTGHHTQHPNQMSAMRQKKSTSPGPCFSTEFVTNWGDWKFPSPALPALPGATHLAIPERFALARDAGRLGRSLPAVQERICADASRGAAHRVLER